VTSRALVTPWHAEIIAQRCIFGRARQEEIMELFDVMRTTFAARDFTDDPLSDETLYRILDNARFAPSGGNRQGTRVIVVRDQDGIVLWSVTLPASPADLGSLAPLQG